MGDLDLEFFREHGYVIGGPIRDPERMREAQEQMSALLESPGPTSEPAAHRHLDSRFAFDLCTEPAVIDGVVQLLGPDVLLWSSRVFSKPAGDAPLPWHQDMAYWPISSDDCVISWIAVDPADRGNGCVEVIPGSHRVRAPHVPSDGTGRFRQKADPSYVDTSEVTAIELEPGEFLLFDCWLMHRSQTNHTDRLRRAISARYIPPTVTVDFHAMSRAVPALGAQVVSGQDSLHRSRHAPRP